MKIILQSVNGVDITERMCRVYAKRFGGEFRDDQKDGIIGSIGGWITGGPSGQEAQNGDAYLLESPETKDLFKGVREAFEMRTAGRVKSEDEFSKVSIKDVVPDWDEFVASLPADQE